MPNSYMYLEMYRLEIKTIHGRGSLSLLIKHNYILAYILVYLYINLKKKVLTCACITCIKDINVK